MLRPSALIIGIGRGQFDGAGPLCHRYACMLSFIFVLPFADSIAAQMRRPIRRYSNSNENETACSYVVRYRLMYSVKCACHSLRVCPFCCVQWTLAPRMSGPACCLAANVPSNGVAQGEIPRRCYKTFSSTSSPLIRRSRRCATRLFHAAAQVRFFLIYSYNLRRRRFY